MLTRQMLLFNWTKSWSNKLQIFVISRYIFNGTTQRNLVSQVTESKVGLILDGIFTQKVWLISNKINKQFSKKHFLFSILS